MGGGGEGRVVGMGRVADVLLGVREACEGWERV